MTQKSMYSAMAGSPYTTTTAAIDVDDTAISVAELSVLPAAPGICMVYVSSTKWERCVYSAKSNSTGAGTITVARSGDGHASTDGSNGPLTFESGAKVMRNITSWDHDVFKNNIEDLATRVSTAESTVSGHTTSIGTNSSDITSLGGRLDTAESTISGHTTSISAKAIAPASTTENKVPQWDSTTKTLKDGLVVGTAANNLIQLDSNAKIPAVDGSAVTGLVPSQFQSGTFDKARLAQEVSRTVILLGSSAEYPATNPAASDSVEMSTNKQVIAGSKFAADSVDKYAQWRFRLPYNYKPSAGFTFRPAFMLKTASGTDTSVIFGIQALIVGSGGSIDTTWGTAVEVTSDVSNLTANTMIYASTSSAVTPAKAPSNLTIVGGEEIIIRLYRSGSDTSASDVILTDVYLVYTTDNYEDA